jgi:hypothetical protein
MVNKTVFVDGNRLTRLPPAESRWGNTEWLADKSQRHLPKSLPSEVLNAVGEEARRLGRPLTDAERESVYRRFD